MPQKPRRIKQTSSYKYEKVFMRGIVGGGHRVINELKKLGGKQEGLFGNNPYYLYYIGEDGIIKFVDIEKPEAYFLLDSSEWEELTFKKEITNENNTKEEDFGDNGKEEDDDS